jgi:hypothetical protein
MARTFRVSVVALLLVVALAPRGSTQAPQGDQRMQWWRDARFGMFIHWGLYAVPAGEYQGKRAKAIGEWIMSWANIPCSGYRSSRRSSAVVRAAKIVRVAGRGISIVIVDTTLLLVPTARSRASASSMRGEIRARAGRRGRPDEVLLLLLDHGLAPSVTSVRGGGQHQTAETQADA